MEAQVKWVGERMFLGETESGHTAVMDGPPEAGGRNMGIRPMEMILLGLGGCAAFDVVDILEKSRESVEDCLLRLEAERAFEDPKVFTRIELCFEVSGRALNPAKVERAVKLSADKYCSASIMLGKTAEISHRFEIVEKDG